MFLIVQSPLIYLIQTSMSYPGRIPVVSLSFPDRTASRAGRGARGDVVQWWRDARPAQTCLVCTSTLYRGKIITIILLLFIIQISLPWCWITMCYLHWVCSIVIVLCFNFLEIRCYRYRNTCKFSGKFLVSLCDWEFCRCISFFELCRVSYFLSVSLFDSMILSICKYFECVIIVLMCRT